MTSLRPDEQAAEAQRKRYEDQNNMIKRGAQGALSLGTGAGLASGLGAKILPFLSEYISPDLALRGISKVAPKVGEFLRRGQSMGMDVKEGFKFVKEKLTAEEESQNAKDNRNIVEQYDPELHTYIQDKIKEGMTPTQAGHKALGHGRFKKALEKIMKDHKTPWASILESIYGGALKGGGKQQPPQQPQQAPQQGQQQQQPTSGVDPELQKIIDGGAAILKKYGA